MNIVVCQYYGLLGGLAKVSSMRGEEGGIDASEPLALRRIWVRGGREIDKIASSLAHPSMVEDVQTLGGPDDAMERVRAEADVMRVWDEAETFGRDLALSKLEAEADSFRRGGR